MTPEMCKRFCQGYGYSVAMLKRGTQCFCSEYSQVMSWNESRFSCSIPCSGNEEKFCGGKETYSAYRTMPGATLKYVHIHIVQEGIILLRVLLLLYNQRYCTAIAFKQGGKENSKFLSEARLSFSYFNIPSCTV